MYDSSLKGLGSQSRVPSPLVRPGEHFGCTALSDENGRGSLHGGRQGSLRPACKNLEVSGGLWVVCSVSLDSRSLYSLRFADVHANLPRGPLLLYVPRCNIGSRMVASDTIHATSSLRPFRSRQERGLMDELADSLLHLGLDRSCFLRILVFLAEPRNSSLNC